MSKLKLAVVASLTLFLPAVAGAVPLTGTFSISGLADVRVGPNFIDWGQVVAPTFGLGTPGDILFTSGTGSFSGLALTQGKIKDLTAPPDNAGVPISEANFLTSNAQPTWDFTLTFIALGTGTAAGCGNVPGAVCTPFAGSPFTITNDAQGGAGVQFSVRGTVDNGLGEVSDWVGTFTTQFPDMTSGEILAQIQQFGFVQNSHSAGFTVSFTPPPPTIPEPATMLLLGTGLLSTGFLKRRNRK
jgi:hypothetical protein